MEKKALVLLSGGLDSTTCLAIALSQHYNVTTLSFNYGQKHKIELELARKNAQKYDISNHIEFSIDLTKIGGSALTTDQPIPQNRTFKQMEEAIPSTYVPARNLIFLSIASAIAEVNDIMNLFIGVNAVDYSGYPDCRSDFIKSFQKTANLATKAGREGRSINIHTPLLALSKSDIIIKGKKLNVDYSQTITCYNPVDYYACGSCDACLLRKKGFEEAGIPDETQYYV